MNQGDLARNLGITTQTFANCIRRGDCTQSDVVAWAAEQRFSWIEIRDFDLAMDRGELGQILRAACDHGIIAHYSWDGTDLVTGPKMPFDDGIRKACAFGQGTLSRVTVAPAFLQRRTQPGYPEEEFGKLVPCIEELISRSRESSITLVFENSYEPLLGRSGHYRGMDDFIVAIPGFRMAFDPANALNSAQAKVTHGWKEVIGFLERNIQRIPYVHLKSTLKSVLQERILADGDIHFDELISLLPASTWMCIELPAAKDFSTATDSILRSREVLVSQAKGP